MFFQVAFIENWKVSSKGSTTFSLLLFSLFFVPIILINVFEILNHGSKNLRAYMLGELPKKKKGWNGIGKKKKKEHNLIFFWSPICHNYYDNVYIICDCKCMWQCWCWCILSKHDNFIFFQGKWNASFQLHDFQIFF